MATIPTNTRKNLVTQGLTVQLPDQPYTVRIVEAKTEAKGADTSRGIAEKRLLRCRVEILEPEVYKVGDTEVSLAGHKFYLVPQRVEPETVNETWAVQRVFAALNNSGFDWEAQFPPNGDWDDEKVGAALVGHTMVVRAKCEPYYLTRDLTPDEVATVAAGGTVPNITEDKRRVHQMLPVRSATGEVTYTKTTDGFRLSARWEDVIAMVPGVGGNVAKLAAGVF